MILDLPSRLGKSENYDIKKKFLSQRKYIGQENHKTETASSTLKLEEEKRSINMILRQFSYFLEDVKDKHWLKLKKIKRVIFSFD